MAIQFKTVYSELNKFNVLSLLVSSEYSLTKPSMHYVYYKDIEGSNEKIFVDLASYSTEDYTFTGSDEFTTRIEILIYKGTSPLSTVYTENLDGFASAVNEECGTTLSFSLPSGTKAETYYEAKNKNDFVYYGYCYCMDAFLYASDLSALYNSLISSLTTNGYELSRETEKGNVVYSKDGTLQTSYIGIIKTSNYIRIVNSILGMKF